jgi:hypothetical protein
MYEMPPSLSNIPKHKWVMELKSRLEEAHSAVRHHTGQEMLRQKQHHDAKINWQIFSKDEQVFVYSHFLYSLTVGFTEQRLPDLS